MIRNLGQSLQTFLFTKNQQFSSQYSILNNIKKTDITQLLSVAASQSIQQKLEKNINNQSDQKAAHSKVDISDLIKQWNSNSKTEAKTFLQKSPQIFIASLLKPIQKNQQSITNQQYPHKQTNEVNLQSTIKQNMKKQQSIKQRQNASDSYSSNKIHQNYKDRNYNTNRNRIMSRQYERDSTLSYNRDPKIYYEKDRERSRSKNRDFNDRQKIREGDRQSRYYKQKERDNWQRQRQKQRQRQRDRQRQRQRQKQKERQYRQREYRQKQRDKDRYHDYKTMQYRDPRYYNNPPTNNTNPYRFYQKTQNQNQNMYGHRKFIENRQSLYHQYSNQYYDYYNREKRYQ